MNLAIIAEYNPFHTGHLYHINASKDETDAKNIIVVMSGNYVQRGEPAIIDKYYRTRFALLNGVSLVLELPVCYATASAEYFAKGAIDILNKTNIIDSLCFGSEIGDISQLKQISDILIAEPSLYKHYLKSALNAGNSYAFSRQHALDLFIGKNVSFLNNPNNILGIEYLKALTLSNSKIKPFTIKRRFSDYNSEKLGTVFSSATAIRKCIANNNLDNLSKFIPNYDFMLEIISNKELNFFKNYNYVLSHLVKTSTQEFLQKILDVNEGLENRIKKAYDQYLDINDIVNFIKTKRYTYTKIQRALLHILLNIKSSDLDNLNKNSYIRVLGFRKDKQFLLKQLIQNSTVPVLTNLKNFDTSNSMLQKEIITTDIYYNGVSFYNNKVYNQNIEFSKPIIII